MISKFKNQNKELKSKTEQLFVAKKWEISKKKPMSAVTHLSSQEMQWRYRYNDLKDFVTKKEKVLFTLHDKLHEINTLKDLAVEETDNHKQIRILENKLDETIIKFNEAQNIKAGYEAQLRTFKEEKVTYNIEIEKIEKELKKKDEEMLRVREMLKHAIKAKESAYVSLKNIDNKREEAFKNYQKNMHEKKKEVDVQIEKAKRMQDNLKKMSREQQSISSRRDMYFRDLPKETDQFEINEAQNAVTNFEEGFQMIMEATGTRDSELISQSNYPEVHNSRGNPRFTKGTRDQI